MGLFDGKVAIVTGGGRGLGRTQALAFAREGCRVVVSDLGCTTDGNGSDPTVAAAVAKEIGHAQALADHEDLSQADGVARMLDRAIAHFGQVDFLAHNAGFIDDRPLVELDEQRWRHSINGVLGGTFLCIQAIARHLIGRDAAGRIVAMTSSVGLSGAAGLPSYAAAKAGVYGLCLAASLELKPHGINVNMISPFAYSRLTAQVFEGMPDAETVYSPERIADAVLFLCSDLAHDVTGQVLDVQGSQLSFQRMTQGVPLHASVGTRWTPDAIRARWAELQG